ncbi:ganglioside GM2 activator-like isoform X1 [Dreissena polymorpha]|uniref:MD-2-related lipid-recognition domain-containing protein n=1 Tax=Dreissena polymorpha TaxID=45954 RepID=A0A9D4DSZ5_DREPO|nr:ganglioside GM2 activator-like isoform X1 [Dreissena polymorpha]KAH3754201.1 hypothetical protein DPMN_188865 [Dreissena polymorpha]
MKTSILCVVLFIASAQGSRKHVREFEIPHSQSKDTSLELSMWKDLIHKKNLTKTESDLKDGFSWKDCGSPSAAVNIQSLSLGPAQLKFPGPINVASVFTVKKLLSAPLMGQVYVYKWILLFYIHVRTYHFDDLCSILARYKNNCPEQLKKIGIDCSCPIAANTYNLKETQLTAPAVAIPSGNYQIKAEVSMRGTQAACMELYFTVA